MVEFAKILKKKKIQEPRVAPARPSFEEKIPEPAPLTVQPAPVAVNSQESKAVEIKPVPVQEQKSELKEPVAPVCLEDTAPLYEKLLFLARQIFHKDVNFEEVDVDKIIGLVTEGSGALLAGDEKLIELSLTSACAEKDLYLFQHAVNVTIISLAIGKGAAYGMERLIELGMTAFFHDIGMTAYQDMSNLPRRLTPEEYEEIKRHVEAGDRILGKIRQGFGESILIAQREIHERLDGSGYPKGKRDLSEYARIIALADGFESMMHPRPFRPRYSVTEVYKRILDAKNKFDPNFIKILVDAIGFFPTGTFVQLNTQEIGRVVRQSPRSPMRPVVRILVGADGARFSDEEAKEINLTHHPTLHVKRCFLDEKTTDTESSM